MTTHLPADLVRRVRLFQNLTHEEIQQLLDASEEVSFAEGTNIFEEAEASQKKRALYVVLEGSVRITVTVSPTVRAELVTVEVGGVFGESSFFHDSVHHATANCLTPVRVIRLRRKKYSDLLAHDNVAAYKLAANAADLLGERLQQTDEWIAKMLQGRQDAELLAKWKQFRHRISRGFSAPSGGFSP